MAFGNESWEWEQMRTWNGMKFGDESWELVLCKRICACLHVRACTRQLHVQLISTPL